MLSANNPALYKRPGGVYAIATVVDDFIERLMHDQRLNANPMADELLRRVPPAGFKYLATEMVCMAAGGPQKYTGNERRAFLDDFQQMLDKFAVPRADQAELKAIIDSTRLATVVAPPIGTRATTEVME